MQKNPESTAPARPVLFGKVILATLPAFCQKLIKVIKNTDSYCFIPFCLFPFRPLSCGLLDHFFEKFEHFGIFAAAEDKDCLSSPINRRVLCANDVH